MATTKCLYGGISPKVQPWLRPINLIASPRVEHLMPSRSDPLDSLSGEIQLMVLDAKAHYFALGAQPVFNHVLQVLRAAARGKLIPPSTNGADPFSKQLAELILYHSLVSESYLPSIPLSPGFERRFALQNLFKRLDSTPGNRASEYVRLLNDPSIDSSDTLVVLYARIADMMTVHHPATARAASTKMPDVFPVHDNWHDVKVTWAWPMLNIYCPFADSGSLTTAYREMRDNAIENLYPREFAELSTEVAKRMPALENTTRILFNILNRLSSKFGIRVLVTTDSEAISLGCSDIDDNTALVRLGAFKGKGGLIDKSLKKGVPVDKVHDWSRATIITASKKGMYDVVAFLQDGGIGAAAREMGVREFHTLPPKDYVIDPKPVTLYESVQNDTVTRDPNMVPMEIIARTVEMHRKADDGTAGHEKYKLAPLQNGELKRFGQRKSEVVAKF